MGRCSCGKSAYLLVKYHPKSQKRADTLCMCSECHEKLYYKDKSAIKDCTIFDMKAFENSRR